MSTALVTGGAGFLGSHLVGRLVTEGWRVVVVDDLRSAPVGLVPLRAEWGRYADVDVLLSDVLDVAELPETPDVVYHLAGPVGATGLLPQAGYIAAEIVALASRVREWALAADCPLVYVATSESFGVGGECHETSPRTFAAGHSARQEYAIGKLAGETLLLNTVGLDVRIVRPFNVAGPRQSGAGGFVTPRFIAQAAAGEALTVHQPGSQLRAFTHVLDIVDGIIRVGRYGEPGGTYNLGRAENRTTITGYAELVIDVVGSGYMTVVDPCELYGPLFTESPDKYPAFSEAMETLGWLPTASLHDIVTDAYAYMRQPEMMERLA